MKTYDARHRSRLPLGALFLAFSSATVATPALALQPLSAFVASARQSNPDNLEALANTRQRAAQSDGARAAYLPSFTAQGVYARNQFDASFALPGGPRVTIAPQNGLDGYFTVKVPLIDVGAWQQHDAARTNVKVAEAQRASGEQRVESSVTRAYYQLLGYEAVLFAAQKSVEAADGNLSLVRDRKELGTASELDCQRAAAELARAEQDRASAEQGVVVSRRGLESLARLTPEPALRENYVEDDLAEEAPLAHWLGHSTSDLVAVKPSVLATKTAEQTSSAARAAWLPTIAAQAQEHATNAGGFTGRNSVYTLTATATWRLDFSLAANVAAQSAAVAGAEARENKARRTAEDAIYQAWHDVRTGIEKARAARAQLAAATLAEELARERYAGGVATQLEVVAAQRDVFAAGVSRVQADFDLQYARALLRISVRQDGQRETSR
jgi:outer membrane protein TolC